MKDTRGAAAKIAFIIALAALALACFHYAGPSFEERESKARTEMLTYEQDADAVSGIKSDPAAFDAKVQAAEAEISGFAAQTGLLPDAVAAWMSNKAAALGISPDAVAIAQSAEGAEQVASGEAAGGGTLALNMQRYTMTVRTGYDAGIAFIKALEEETSASWSVDGFVYTMDEGGIWTVGLKLYYSVAHSENG
ncbi:MAG: hypothetical protein LBG82_03250 [Clostridiales Family XIII bacterium]|jgi:hypothetical protein|nr:hypothetical protein [Clostridiales Family XIII bacterium]